MNMKTFLWPVFGFLIPLVGCAASFVHYKNLSNYGFSADIPDGYVLCTDTAPAPDHGFYLRFDKKTCSSDEPKEVFQVFVSYNVGSGEQGERADTVSKLAQLECGPAVIRLSNYSFDGLQVYECDVGADKGYKRREFIVQKIDSKNITSSRNFLITLQAGDDVFLQRLKEMEAVMRSIKISG